MQRRRRTPVVMVSAAALLGGCFWPPPDQSAPLEIDVEFGEIECIDYAVDYCTTPHEITITNRSGAPIMAEVLLDRSITTDPPSDPFILEDGLCATALAVDDSCTYSSSVSVAWQPGLVVRLVVTATAGDLSVTAPPATTTFPVVWTGTP